MVPVLLLRHRWWRAAFCDRRLRPVPTPTCMTRAATPLKVESGGDLLTGGREDAGG